MEIRSFLAFELPPGMKQAISRTSGELRPLGLDVRWVNVDNIHLTVVFMGNVRAEALDPIREGVGAVCEGFGPFRAALGRVGFFGTRKDPRVLWVGLSGDLDRMSGFRDALQEGLRPFGVLEEKRPFRPHLTLGRFKSGARWGTVMDGLLEKYERLEGPECLLDELILFRSELKPGGAVYSRIGAWPLKGTK